MRQIDRLIATFDTRDDLEPEALLPVGPSERLSRARGVSRVVDHEGDQIAAKQVSATKRRMLVRLPAASSHRDRPRMRKAGIHLPSVPREVRGYQRTRVAPLRKRLLVRREGAARDRYRCGREQSDTRNWHTSFHLVLLSRRRHVRISAAATLQEPGNSLDEVLF